MAIAALHIGEFQIDSIVELDAIAFRAPKFYAGATAEEVEAERQWLPTSYIADDGKLLIAIQSYLIRTKDLVILVDTCTGNDKDRGGVTPYHKLNTPYLSRLRELGVAPSDVDYVMCTHLHVDHVGWNTVLENGRWIPTFPNARHLYVKREFDYWEAAARAQSGSALHRASFVDSVRPIMEAGLAQLVESQHELRSHSDYRIGLQPLPGHTAGHCGIHLASRDAQALLLGDAIHHPIQFAKPAWRPRDEYDRDAAIESTRWLINTYTDTNILMLGAHFRAPVAGRLKRVGTSVRWLADGQANMGVR
jgi:glyoxylase-like metal-dependent hydrolase (beta-lactamase superfamily II)